MDRNQENSTIHQVWVNLTGPSLMDNVDINEGSSARKDPRHPSKSSLSSGKGDNSLGPNILASHLWGKP